MLDMSLFVAAAVDLFGSDSIITSETCIFACIKNYYIIAVNLIKSESSEIQI